ncbi:alkanal monooxygenase [Streptomyces dioscori]|uniref:Alkanal monooxygenase n=1 Tax=Streptomyces dioscori TaxID=2109333 RepID=A0A2P8Q9N9_9ACTN|nr:LLM class flavin-dependent oxidoreductase [Streptomyces dioscori]PSM42967.1 alkanal monooxygenase [Streptomyces dioscori]
MRKTTVPDKASTDGPASLPPARVADMRPHGTSPAPLSVLDLTVVGEQDSPAEALRQTAEMAQLAERWGYRRFWVSEHHSFPASGSPAPAVLLAHLANVTRTIRLGSGGVMLTNHAPMVVAEQFGLLDALHPGRLDLGVGRAPGSLPSVAQALRRIADDTSTESFESQVNEVRNFLRGEFPEGHPYRRDQVHVVPKAPALPIWLLGSGTTGAEVAARLGLPFAAAHHINPVQTPRAIKVYREKFRPSEMLQAPHVMVAAQVVCVQDEAEAVSLARSGGLMLMLAAQGKLSVIPSPKTAEKYPYTADEQQFLDTWLERVIGGTPDAVRAGLTELQASMDADELMLTSLIHDPTARRLSHALVAQEFGLTGEQG